IEAGSGGGHAVDNLAGGLAGEGEGSAGIGVGQRIDLLPPEIAAEGEVVGVVYEDEALAHGAGLVAAESGRAVGKPVDAAGKRKVGRSPINGRGRRAGDAECFLDVRLV